MASPDIGQQCACSVGVIVAATAVLTLVFAVAAGAVLVGVARRRKRPVGPPPHAGDREMMLVARPGGNSNSSTVRGSGVDCCLPMQSGWRPACFYRAGPF